MRGNGIYGGLSPGETHCCDPWESNTGGQRSHLSRMPTELHRSSLNSSLPFRRPPSLSPAGTAGRRFVHSPRHARPTAIATAPPPAPNHGGCRHVRGRRRPAAPTYPGKAPASSPPAQEASAAGVLIHSESLISLCRAMAGPKLMWFHSRAGTRWRCSLRRSSATPSRC